MKLLYLVLNFYYFINSIQSACVNNNECSFGYIRDNNDCIECGFIPEEPNLKIVGGIEAVPHSYPSQALLIFVLRNIESNKIYPLFCGGTLINKYTILTAAHCTYVHKGFVPLPKDKTETELIPTRESAFSVFLGVHDYSFIFDINTSKPENVKKHEVKKIIDHPEFNMTSLENDISMLILSEPVEFTKEIHPACLPKEISTIYPEPNTYVFVSGWGDVNGFGNYPTQLNNVILKIFEPFKCEIFANDTHLDWSKQICAGEESKSACFGDSGGGLYIDLIIGDKLKRIVTGIVSFGLKTCSSEGVYTRISFYLDWIKENWRIS